MEWFKQTTYIVCEYIAGAFSAAHKGRFYFTIILLTISVLFGVCRSNVQGRITRTHLTKRVWLMHIVAASANATIFSY